MNEMWYALVQEEQLGPMSFNEVIDFYYKDIITSETLLWREGLKEWVPIIQVQEFKELLFQGDFLSPVVGGANARNADTSIFNPEHHSPSASVAPAVTGEGDAEPAEIEELEELEELDDVLEELEDPEELLTPPPSEVASEPSPPRLPTPQTGGLPPPPVQSNQATPQPIAERETIERQGELSLSEGLVTPGRSAVVNPMPSPPLVTNVKRPKKGPWGILMAVAALCFVGGGYVLGELGVISSDLGAGPLSATQDPRSTSDALDSSHVTNPIALPTPARDQSSTHSVITANPTPSSSATAQGPQAGTAPSTAPSTAPATTQEELVLSDIDLSDPVPSVAGAQAQAEPVVEAQSAQGAVEKKTVEPAPAKVVSKKSKKPVKARSKARTRPKKRPRKVVKKRPSKSKKPLPNMLSRSDISKVVNGASGRLKSCAESDANLKGTTVVVNVRIASSGRVASADPSTPRLVRSPQKGCVLKVIKRLKFPPFSGEMPAMPLPIRL